MTTWQFCKGVLMRRWQPYSRIDANLQLTASGDGPEMQCTAQHCPTPSLCRPSKQPSTLRNLTACMKVCVYVLYAYMQAASSKRADRHAV